MIRLAWSRLRCRPVRGAATALLAALLGVLAAPSTLFLLACALFLPAALVIGGPRTDLSTLATLGRPWRHLAGAVLAEYVIIGAGAAIVAVPAAGIAAAGIAAAGIAAARIAPAGIAAAVAFAVTLAAGVVRAATAAEPTPNAERSRPS